MNGKIQKVLTARNAALTFQNCIALHQFKAKALYETRKAKRAYAKEVE